jgi:hypothetical protein
MLEAARRICGEGGQVTLSQILSDPEVARTTVIPARVIGVMQGLEDHGLVRMTVRHPVATWAMTTAGGQP